MSLSIEEALAQIASEQKKQVELQQRQLEIFQQQVKIYNSARKYTAIIGYPVLVLVIFSILYLMCGALMRSAMNEKIRHRIFANITDRAICETALEEDERAVIGYRWDQYAEETREARHRRLTVAKCLVTLGIAVPESTK